MFRSYLETRFPLEQLELELINNTHKNTTELFNKVFDMKWSYSIKEFRINDKDTKNSKVVILTVCMPGTIRDGIGAGPTTDQAIESALLSVLKSLKKPIEVVINIPFQSIVQDVNSLPTVTITTTNNPVQIIEATPVVDIEPPSKRVLDSMMKFKFTREQAEVIINLCTEYKISSTSVLLKYLKAFDTSITKVSDFGTKDLEAFKLFAVEKGFNIEDGEVNG
jgi:hypothetical protein